MLCQVPRPRTHDDSLRRRLLDEGGRLLSAEGPGAVTTRRLAARAGTSSSAVYNLFGDKPALIRAMFAEGFRRLARHLATVPATDDPAADLVALGQAFRASARASPHLYHLMFGAPFPDVRPGEAEAREAQATFQTLVVAVRRCLAARVIGPADPQDVAIVLFALVDGLARLELDGWLGDAEAADRRWDMALRATLRGLAREGPERPPSDTAP
jgi:AcrR family transcriptional regulator